MMDDQEAKGYYQTGLFVLITFSLLVFFVMILGGVNWFHKPTYIESYFDESVQGLSEGSSVKYRGVTVGEVEAIDFIGDHYRSDVIANDMHWARYVYVKMALRTVSFLAGTRRSFSKRLSDAVANGFRVHLAQEGLTGNAYLELDFASPDVKRLPLKWQPRLYYVPSRPSTLFAISDSLHKVFKALKTVDFKQIGDNMVRLSMRMDQSFERINALLMMEQDSIARSLENIGNITEHLGLAVENVSAYPSGFMRTTPILGE